MPLPWMIKKQQTGIATEYRAPDQKPEEKQEDGLKIAARDLMEAISSGSEEKAAAALRAAFQILDSEPHVEGEHIEEESE